MESTYRGARTPDQEPLAARIGRATMLIEYSFPKMGAGRAFLTGMFYTEAQLLKYTGCGVHLGMTKGNAAVAAGVLRRWRSLARHRPCSLHRPSRSNSPGGGPPHTAGSRTHIRPPIARPLVKMFLARSRNSPCAPP
ncbi:hypothetical protein KM043_004556 [Ampulex compressa]|nr:hypothetical protein KM043_004556 [Ampulex compressa]